ncbi:peptidylprolyl isomerase [Microbacterium galbinum]|uniref:Peptidyl-prolyl cis-trans isomerase n=1 Tax=Microbacterium galbinum TaxID=2851646 RepID=A0ABY4IMB6_9MICO|nr:peptidylprolyl isomerase [Microbacterium galbinum]UPL13907.1 peptidyl-prolyl cis-trans isomerase [Microbacterium galbinum]
MDRRQHRRRLAAWGAGVLALAAVAAVAIPLTVSSPARAEIDGIVLTDDELAIGVDRAGRAAEQAGGDDADVRAAAIDSLRDDLALLEVARAVGATDLERPADILDALDEVNAARAEAQRAGEVVYGPISYSARTFYSKSLTDIREATARALLSSDDPRFAVGDDEVRARFDAESSEWASAATTHTLTRLRTDEADPAAAQAILERALATGDTADVQVETITVADAELVDGLWNPETAAAIRAADIGGTAGPEPSRSGWAAYRVDAREVDADAAYERYRERIRSVLLDEKLTAAIAEARAHQNVSD